MEHKKRTKLLIKYKNKFAEKLDCFCIKSLIIVILQLKICEIMYVTFLERASIILN